MDNKKVYLVPRAISPFNNVYNVKDSEMKSTQYSIHTSFRFWKRLLSNLFAKLPVFGTLGVAAFEWVQYAHPIYTLYEKDKIVAKGVSGLTSSGRRKMEIVWGGRKVNAYIDQSSMTIDLHDAQIPKQLCKFQNNAPQREEISELVCGFKITAKRSPSFRFTTHNGTKIKPFDLYHSRVFVIEKIQKQSPISMEIMCLLVYFWERNATLGLLSNLIKINAFRVLLEQNQNELLNLYHVMKQKLNQYLIRFAKAKNELIAQEPYVVQSSVEKYLTEGTKAFDAALRENDWTKGKLFMELFQIPAIPRGASFCKQFALRFHPDKYQDNPLEQKISEYYAVANQVCSIMIRRGIPFEDNVAIMTENQFQKVIEEWDKIQQLFLSNQEIQSRTLTSVASDLD